jgi:uncharacterized protein
MQSLTRILLWLVGVPLVLWLALVGYVWLAQSSLLYVPTRLAAVEAEAYARQVGASAIRDGVGEVLGWRFASKASAACTSEWLLAHGNGGMALHRDYVAERLNNALGPGACLSILEYPGYGAASGAPGRESILERARTLLGVVQSQRALQDPPPPLLLIGESLGSGVVAALTREQPDAIAGLLLLTPYDDLAAVAQGHFPWLPARCVLRDRFVPAEDLAGYVGPVLVVVAGADTVIPPQHAKTLASALQQPLLQVEVGLDHNDLDVRPEWWSRVRELLPSAR